jgi:hypothetical protein
MNGMLARSHKEFSFLNVFSVSGLTLYLLIPALVANYTAIGKASLFTPLLYYAQQSPVSVQLLLFLLPAYILIGMMIMYVASMSWNYERLYRYDSPLIRFLEMIHAAVKRPWHYIIFGIFAVPFAWFLQLGIVILFLVVQIPGRLFLFLLLAAYIEELVRNLAVYTHVRDRFEAKTMRGKRLLLISLFTGLGFVIAEKAVLIVSIAPFLEGYQMLIMTGIIVPLLMHSGLTYLYVLVARKIRRRYYLAIGFTAFLHAIINFAIITAFGVHVI